MRYAVPSPFAVLACAALLAGCTGGASSADGARPGPPRPTVDYACDGGKGVCVAFPRGADFVTVKAGGVEKTLPHAVSASGARYADGAFEYWSKGPEAMLDGFPGGPYSGCKER